MAEKSPKIQITPEFYEKDVMYGMATMGPRGQIVIPAEARKDLGIEVGDKLIVMGKFGKVLSLTKTEDIEGIVSMMMDHLVDNNENAPFQKHVEKQLEELRKFTNLNN